MSWVSDVICQNSVSSHQELTVSWIASTAFAAVALAADAARSTWIRFNSIKTSSFSLKICFFSVVIVLSRCGELFFGRAAKSAVLVSCCPFVALSRACKEECEWGAKSSFWLNQNERKCRRVLNTTHRACHAVRVFCVGVCFSFTWHLSIFLNGHIRRLICLSCYPDSCISFLLFWFNKFLWPMCIIFLVYFVTDLGTVEQCRR